MQDQLTAQVRIAVVDCHVPGSGFVRRGSESAGQGCVLDMAVDQDVLALANVRADANGELGIALEEVVVGHGRGL